MRCSGHAAGVSSGHDKLGVGDSRTKLYRLDSWDSVALQLDRRAMYPRPRNQLVRILNASTVAQCRAMADARQ